MGPGAGLGLRLRAGLALRRFGPTLAGAAGTGPEEKRGEKRMAKHAGRRRPLGLGLDEAVTLRRRLASSAIGRATSRSVRITATDAEVAMAVLSSA